MERDCLRRVSMVLILAKKSNCKGINEECKMLITENREDIFFDFAQSNQARLFDAEMSDDDDDELFLTPSESSASSTANHSRRDYSQAY